MILSGREVASAVKKELSVKAESFLKKYGRRPLLAVVLAGNNPASLTYVSGKQKACEEIGIDHRDFFFDADVTRQTLIKTIEDLNSDESVDGILVQLPLPRHEDEEIVINTISPEKDVDGFTPSNVGKLLLGQIDPDDLVACTPKGILRMIDYYGICTDSKNICILGRSNIVGKPMAALLMQRDRNATVTVCHSLTDNIVPHVKIADIVISAVGKPGIVTSDMIKEGAVIIDVGMNRIPDSSKKSGYRLTGDVDYPACLEKAGAITPVPGGVGPMTIAMLMENTIIAAYRHR